MLPTVRLNRNPRFPSPSLLAAQAVSLVSFFAHPPYIIFDKNIDKKNNMHHSDERGDMATAQPKLVIG